MKEKMKKMNLSEIFYPEDINNFQDNFFNKASFYIEGNSEKFKHILDWEDLNSILDTTVYPDETIKLTKDSVSKNFNSLHELRTELNNGYTLVINKLHIKLKTIGKLAEEISRYFNEPTQVNLYLSQPSVRGFELHYDAHDVLIFQLYGKKIWEIYEPTVDKPVFVMKEHGKKKSTMTPYLNITLSPGDLLYVPRGHWHAPLTCGDEPSLHLTLGIMSRTGLNYLEWLKGELSESALWRDSFTFNQEAHFEKLKTDLINKITDPKFFEQYKHYCQMNLWKINELCLPYSFLQIEKYRLTTEKLYIPSDFTVDIKQEAEIIIIYANNKKISLDKKVELLMRHLLAGNIIDLSQLNGSLFNLTDEKITAMLQFLFSEGIVSVYRDTV